VTLFSPSYKLAHIGSSFLALFSGACPSCSFFQKLLLLEAAPNNP
jgi:hypothetical protein